MWPERVRNGLKRPLNGLKRGYKRAKNWRPEVIFAPRIMAGEEIRLWPPRSYPSPFSVKTYSR